MSLADTLDRLRRAYRRRTETVYAVLGDGQGRVYVPNQRGKVYVRFPASSDDLGVSTYTPPFVVNNTMGAQFKTYDGAGVRIGTDDYGELAVLRADGRDMIQANIDPGVLNAAAAETQYIGLAQMQLFRCFPNSAATPSTKVSVSPLMYYDAYGALNHWNATAQLDLASYIPTTANHRVVVVWLDTYANSLSASASTTQAMTVAIDLTDYAECFAAAPAEVMPVQGYYLSNAQTAVTVGSIGIDLRQFINVPSALGNPNPISRNERLRTGQEVAYATTLVIDATFDIDGTLVLL
jgi:hypothetical protein